MNLRAGPRAGLFRGLAVLGLVALAAGVLTVASGAGVASASAAATTSASAPVGEYAGRLRFDVAAVDPVVVTASGPTAMTVTGTVTNTGAEPLRRMEVRFQRGEALTDTAAVRDELADPGQPITAVQERFAPFVADLAPGAALPFAVSVPIQGARTDSLAIEAAGIYPVMINVNGWLAAPGGDFQARIGELHLLTTVRSLPGPTAGSPPATGAASPVPLNVAWPLVDRPHLGVGGVFLDDGLAEAIRPGGRLNALLEAAGDLGAPPGTGTLVVDPLLLEELSLMVAGYRVLEPGTRQGVLTPAAPEPSAPPETAGVLAGTTQPTQQTQPVPAPGAVIVDTAGTVAGAGQADAARFLQRLRELSARVPVLLLPYSDPDVVALSGAGVAGRLSDAAERGRAVAERVLGVGTRIISMAAPVDGLLTADALTAFRTAGYDTALLAAATVLPVEDAAGSGAPAVVVGADGGSGLRAALAETGVLPSDADPDGNRAGWGAQLNDLAALLTQRSADGLAAPEVLLLARDWSPDPTALGQLTELLRLLGSPAGSGTAGDGTAANGASPVLTALSLPDLAAAASAPTTVNDEVTAADVALPAAYLERIADAERELDSLAAALSPAAGASQPDPTAYLDTLAGALDGAASAALRADTGPGEAVLDTVERSAAAVRGSVGILSAGNAYTLASSTSPLLLTLQNNLPYPVQVRVLISGGEQVGLRTADPGVQLIPAQGSLLVKIDAEVSRSGAFQVGAQLVGVDGSAWGSAVQLSVTSTAYGALTFIVIAVAGGVLLVMVVLRITQRFRARQARLARERAGSAPETAPDPVAPTPVASSSAPRQ